MNRWPETVAPPPLMLSELLTAPGEGVNVLVIGGSVSAGAGQPRNDHRRAWVPRFFQWCCPLPAARCVLRADVKLHISRCHFGVPMTLLPRTCQYQSQRTTHLEA